MRARLTPTLVPEVGFNDAFDHPRFRKLLEQAYLVGFAARLATVTASKAPSEHPTCTDFVLDSIRESLLHVRFRVDRFCVCRLVAGACYVAFHNPLSAHLVRRWLLPRNGR